MRAWLAAMLRAVAQRLAPAPTTDAVVKVYLDGEQIVQAIKKRNRRKGLGSAGI